MRRVNQSRAIYTLFIINLIGSLLVPSLATAIGSESRVLLCTSQGYQWVSVEIAQEFKLANDDQSSEHCLYCLSANEDVDQVNFALASFDIAETDNLHTLTQRIFSHSEHLAYLARPRAPPIFI